MGTIQLNIPGKPPSKPRMTQRDKWKKRPAVERYNTWKDLCRACMIEQGVVLPPPKSILRLDWVAYFEPPAGHPERLGKIHRQTPDRDNIDKAVLDSLFDRDEAIGVGIIAKYWGAEARIEITIVFEETEE